MKITQLAVLVTLVAGSLSNAHAQVPVVSAVPGKSLWGFQLGSSRQTAITGVGKKFAKAKHQPPQTLAQGLTYDVWEIPKGDQFTLLEMLSKQGKIIQLRTWTSEGFVTKHSFAQLLKAQPLRKSVYLFLDHGGGGYNTFYYTNLKKGITYTGGTQDMFILTSQPDGLIIHRPGVPAIAFESGIQGKPVTGPNARAFKDAAEAERVIRQEIKVN